MTANDSLLKSVLQNFLQNCQGKQIYLDMELCNAQARSENAEGHLALWDNVVIKGQYSDYYGHH